MLCNGGYLYFGLMNLLMVAIVYNGGYLYFRLGTLGCIRYDVLFTLCKHSFMIY